MRKDSHTPDLVWLESEGGSRSVVSDSSRPYGLYERMSEVAQLCPTLYDPMDCSLPGSAVHGILQARILKWVAISFSLQAESLPLSHQGSPVQFIVYSISYCLQFIVFADFCGVIFPLWSISSNKMTSPNVEKIHIITEIYNLCIMKLQQLYMFFKY